MEDLLSEKNDSKSRATYFTTTVLTLLGIDILLIFLGPTLLRVRPFPIQSYHYQQTLPPLHQLFLLCVWLALIFDIHVLELT